MAAPRPSAATSPRGDGGAGPDGAQLSAGPRRGRRGPGSGGGRERPPLLGPAEASAQVGADRGPRRHLHPSLRHGRSGPSGPGPGRGRGTAGGGHLRTDRGARPSAARGRSRPPGTVRAADGGPGHRGLHPDPAGRGAHPGPGVLTDDRHRAPPRRVLGHGRTGRTGDLRRPPPPDHLRAAHRRRPDGLRRTGCAVPLRFGHPPGVRPGHAACTSRCARRWSTCSRRWPGPRSPTAGAARSGSPATGSLGRARPRHRPGVGRRLRRRRRVHHQPGRADPARPHPGRDTDLDRPPLGRPPVEALGARTAALPRDQRRAVDHEAGRPQRGQARPPSRLAGVMGRLLGQ